VADLWYPPEAGVQPAGVSIFVMAQFHEGDATMSWILETLAQFSSFVRRFDQTYDFPPRRCANRRLHCRLQRLEQLEERTLLSIGGAAVEDQWLHLLEEDRTVYLAVPADVGQEVDEGDLQSSNLLAWKDGKPAEVLSPSEFTNRFSAHLDPIFSEFPKPCKSVAIVLWGQAE
jgi:hypothetical protein